MSRNTLSAVAQLVVTLVGVAFVFFQYVSFQETAESKILLAVFFLFATTMIPDKIGAAFTAYSYDKDQKAITDLFNKLPSMTLGRHDIITFQNRAEGLRYCIYACKDAGHIKNTVLRHGVQTTSSWGHSAYTPWLDAKRHSVENTDCNWTEIVSRYFDEDDPVSVFVAKHNSRSSKYQARFIDDRISPMIQMTLFDFNGNRELLFGWEFPGIENGPCFLTRNERIIDFFEKYFIFHFNNASPQKVSPGPITPQLLSSDERTLNSPNLRATLHRRSGRLGRVFGAFFNRNGIS